MKPWMAKALARQKKIEEEQQRGRIKCSNCGALTLWTHAALRRICGLCGAELPKVVLKGGHK
jgi:ribosomal protein S27AE